MTALDRGLALHLPLTGIDDGVVLDASGNGNNATPGNGAQPVADARLGGCFAMDANAFISIPALGTSDTLTIQVWVFLDAVDGVRPLLHCPDTPDAVALRFVDGVLQVGLGSADPTEQSFGFSFQAGTWHHLTISYRGRDRQITLHVDGASPETRQYVTAPAITLPATMVGWDGTASFKGRIGALRIYRRALTQDEIRQIIQSDLALLVLHLPLTELRDGVAADAAGSTLVATSTGNPATVLDEVFGRSLRFDGDDMLTMPDAEALRLSTYTVSIWLKPEIPDQTWQGIVGKPGRDFNIWLYENGLIHHRFSVGDDWNNGAPDTPAGSVTWNEWNHVAITNDGHTATTYVNGLLAATGPTGGIPATHQTDLLLAGDLDGNEGRRFKGSLANLRIYRAALPADAIRQAMAEDQAATTAFRRSHPLTFRLLDTSDEPVLPIDTDPAGHQLFVEISNTADEPITLRAITSPPTAADHHFALRFRPGTLSASCLDTSRPEQLVRVAGDEWRTSAPVTEDRAVVCYLASTTDRRLDKGRTWHLTVEHAIADVAGGTRATRVELCYQRLGYDGQDTPLSGSRTQLLKVINRLGRPSIPLHVGFTGGNTVLNDAGQSESLLVLHVGNLATGGPIPLAPRDTSAAPTRLRISFDHEPTTRPELERPWALGTANDLKDVDVPANAPVREDWQVERSSAEAEGTEITLVPVSRTSLDVREIVEIPLARIRSSLPSGPANLYVRYENVPGYQDGQFVCQVVKGPLVPSGGRVGVGAGAPEALLHVREQSGTAHGPNTGTVLIDHEDGGGASSIVFRSRGNRGSDYGFIQYQDAASVGGQGESSRLEIGTRNDADDHLLLSPGGNVGVGTTIPKRKLHVAGDYYGRGHMFLHAYEGDHNDGTAYVQARDDSGSTSVGLRLRTQSGGQVVEAAHLAPDGRMSVGNTDPRSRLTVHGSTNISADGDPVGLMTLVFHGWIDNGENKVHTLYSLRSHTTSHVDLTVLVHDVNSNTNWYSSRADYVVLRSWTRPPVIQTLTEHYTKAAGNIYRSQLLASGNDIQVRVSQQGFDTNSVYKVVARYLLGRL